MPGADAGPSDTIKPSFATFEGPPEGGTSRRTVTFTYSASDNSGLEPTLTCMLDNLPVTNGCSSPRTFNGLRFGPHRFAISATDAKGNYETITRTWTVTPASSGQLAELVVGQPDFTTKLTYMVNEKQVYPWGVAWDGQMLWIADGRPNGGRVMGWTGAPSANFTEAINVLGQPTLDSSSWVGPTQSAFAAPADVHEVSAVIGTIAVVDINRVMIFTYDDFDTLNGKPATVVLGQPDFTSTGPGVNGNQLNQPSGVWTNGHRVIVSDSGNDRVLIWNSLPSTNGVKADLVLGAENVDSMGNRNEVTPSSMGLPRGAFYDGQRLYVVDSYHSRVLIWNEFPTTNNAPADVVVGQKDLNTFEFSLIPTNRDFNSPDSITVASNNLFVCDFQRSRVLVFSPCPTGDHAEASVVLGQDDFSAKDIPVQPDQKHFRCQQMAVGGSRLYVVDSGFERVLGFKLELE